MAATENPEARERRIAVRAGLFIALGIAVAGIVIFLIGKERNLFDRQMTYFGAFENVDGLALDAPVRLGGLNAGRVSTIAFAPELEDKRIIVTMEVSERFRDRVRRDSVARVTSRGVLGDKAIDISLGSPQAEVIGRGGEIATGSSGDLSSLLKGAGEIVDNAVSISRDLRGAVAAYSDPDLRKDVGGLIKSARNVIGEIETGKGALHAVVYDARTAQDVKALIASASASATRLDGAITSAQSILQEVREGNGSAHALIYDRALATSLAEVGKAADEIATLIHDAKKAPNGAVNQLVYGDARHLFEDLGAAAADLKAITSKVKSGEGSLGGVIYDPSVYEDLKEILGNVKRNRVLRELVRFSISNGENLDAAGKPAQPAPGK